MGDQCGISNVHRCLSRRNAATLPSRTVTSTVTDLAISIAILIVVHVQPLAIQDWVKVSNMLSDTICSPSIPHTIPCYRTASAGLSVLFTCTTTYITALHLCPASVFSIQRSVMGYRGPARRVGFVREAEFENRAVQYICHIYTATHSLVSLAHSRFNIPSPVITTHNASASPPPIHFHSVWIKISECSSAHLSDKTIDSTRSCPQRRHLSSSPSLSFSSTRRFQPKSTGVQRSPEDQLH